MSQTLAIIAAFVIITVLLFLFCFARWMRSRSEDEDIIRRIAHGKVPVRLNRSQLARYTNNYSGRLGAGAFGTVYRGTLPNGLKVVVKKLHLHAGVDWRSEKEFITDVVGTIGQARHTNLVKLVGYSFYLDTSSDVVDRVFVRALVWEYMERGAFLVGWGRDAGGNLPVLNLHSLAVGVARGIRYLHEVKIVHYGIKLSNVLLDRELITPKVADFGLAQLMRRGDAHAAATAVSMQPPALTYKFDVYSFGMLLLQMVALSQGRNLYEASLDSFPRLMWTKYKSGNLVADDDDHVVVTVVAAIDDTVERVCKVAFWCVQPQPDARPPMGVVVKMLEGDMDISPPPNPFEDQWGC